MAADLIDVIDKNGNPARVSPEWLSRWPDDFRPITDQETTAPAVKDSPAGDKKKEN